MDERKLRVLERTKTETKVEEKKDVKTSRHTNPISKRLVEFHHEQAGKFSVKDIFKK